jgi:iron-regulated transporter 1
VSSLSLSSQCQAEVISRSMGLQFSMQSMADLAKYIVTIILSRPQQFRWASLISFLSVCAGVFSYCIYVKKERKHLFHPEWIPLLRKAV